MTRIRFTTSVPYIVREYVSVLRDIDNFESVSLCPVPTLCFHLCKSILYLLQPLM